MAKGFIIYLHIKIIQDANWVGDIYLRLALRSRHESGTDQVDGQRDHRAARPEGDA